MHADDQVAGAPAEMTAVDGVEGETPPEEVVGAAEAPGPAVDVDEGMGGPAENGMVMLPTAPRTTSQQTRTAPATALLVPTRCRGG
jgi:hypothetical protein